MQHSKKTLITLLQTIRKMTVYVNTRCIILHLEFLHLFYTFFCMSTSNLRKKTTLLSKNLLQGGTFEKGLQSISGFGKIFLNFNLML